MIDHLSVACSDLNRSSAFYDAVLSCLGYVRVYTGTKGSGWASPGNEEKFAIKLRSIVTAPGPGFHLAFAAPSPKSVDEFFAEALRLGAIGNGKPGLRPEYGPGYYAAYISDLDGHLIEAVCHISDEQ